MRAVQQARHSRSRHVYSRDIVRVKGFPLDLIEELFIVVVYCMYSQHATLVIFLVNFTF